MRVLAGLIFVLSFVFATPSFGQNTAPSCSTMVGVPGVAIYVDSLSAEMIEKGMTENVFAVEIERLLLEAGVPILHPTVNEEDFEVPGSPTLYVGITTVFQLGDSQCLYGIRVEFTQTVRLERNPEYAVEHVPTWGVGGIGVYAAGWREAILEDVREFTRQFIDAYAKVNPVVEK